MRSRRGTGSRHKVLTTPQDGFRLTANAMKARLLPASPPTPALRPSWDGRQHDSRLRVYRGHVDRCPRESGSRPQPFPLRTKPEFESRSQGRELARPSPVITSTTSTGDRSSGNRKTWRRELALNLPRSPGRLALRLGWVPQRTLVSSFVCILWFSTFTPNQRE